MYYYVKKDFESMRDSYGLYKQALVSKVNLTNSLSRQSILYWKGAGADFFRKCYENQLMGKDYLELFRYISGTEVILSNSVEALKELLIDRMEIDSIVGAATVSDIVKYDDKNWTSFSFLVDTLESDNFSLMKMLYNIMSDVYEIVDVSSEYSTVDSAFNSTSKIVDYRDALCAYGKKVVRFDEYLSNSFSGLIVSNSLNIPLIPNSSNDYAYQSFLSDINEIDETAFLINEYGFSQEDAELLYKVIKAMEEKSGKDPNSPECIQYVYGRLACLCTNYDSKRWRYTTGQPSGDDTIKWLQKKIGLSEEEVNQLVEALNEQHRNPEAKIDYVHQCVQLAAFAQGDLQGKFGHFKFGRYAVDLFNSSDFQYSYTDYEISFKGDADSTRYDRVDFASDVDAINLYQRLLAANGEQSSLVIFSEYYMELDSGETNRAEEFLKILGDGDTGIGILNLDEILKKDTFGSQYIESGNPSVDGLNQGDIEFMRYVLFELYGREYVFEGE